MDVVELCEKLISIDSINPFCFKQQMDDSWQIEGNEKELFDFCHIWLEREGFRISYQDCGGGRRNLLAEKGDAKDSLLLYAHVDTVGLTEGWTKTEALTPKRGERSVDGRMQEVIYGLGSNDMKGGIAILLQAICGFTPKHFRLKLVLGCDEEFWSLGSHCLVQKSNFLDDVIGAIIPEVGESTDEPEPDKWLVTLGRCGRAEICIDIPGTGGHGAEPDRPDRVNALTQAAKIAIAVEEMSKRYQDFFPFGSKGMSIRPSALVTHLEGGMGTLSVPDHASIIVNRVLVPGESEESALLGVKQLLENLKEKGELLPVKIEGKQHWPKVSARSRPTPALQPYLSSSEEPFVQKCLEVIAKHGDFQKGFGASVADENRFGAEANLPVIVLGPRGENAHAAYEWVTIESLQKLTKIYRALLEAFDSPS